MDVVVLALSKKYTDKVMDEQSGNFLSKIQQEGQSQIENIENISTQKKEEIESINSLLPKPTIENVGKVPVVNSEGNDYILTDSVLPSDGQIGQALIKTSDSGAEYKCGKVYGVDATLFSNYQKPSELGQTFTIDISQPLIGSFYFESRPTQIIIKNGEEVLTKITIGTPMIVEIRYISSTNVNFYVTYASGLVTQYVYSVTDNQTTTKSSLYTSTQIDDLLKSKINLPDGGTQGQILTKTSDQSNDYAWKDPVNNVAIPNITQDDEGKILGVSNQEAKWLDAPSGESNWKLLFDTTLEEDVSNVSFDIDTQGNPFSCNELFVVSDQKAHEVSTISYFNVYVNNTTGQTFASVIVNNAENLFKAYFKVICGRFYTVCAFKGANDFSLGTSLSPYGNALYGGDMGQQQNITSILIGTRNGSVTMSSGSIIRVYGR